MKNLIPASLILMTAFSAIAIGTLSDGVSVRANSMGNAYTAIANDVTALYWNPAGLSSISGIEIYCGSVISFPEYSYNRQSDSVSKSPESNSNTPPIIMPSGGVVWNGLLDGKITVGFAVYIPAGVHIEIPNNEESLLFPRTNTVWKNNLTIYEFAPGISYTPIPQLSIGAALYVDYGIHKLSKSVYLAYSGILLSYPGTYTEDSTGFGVGGIVGVKVNPTDCLSIGITFKPKRTLSMDGSANVPEFATFSQEEYRISPTSDFTRELPLPMELSTGIAINIIEPLTISADFRYIYWEDAMDVIATEFADADWKVAMGTSSIHNDFADGQPYPYIYRGRENELGWNNSEQYGIGAEYRINQMFAARAGYFRGTVSSPPEMYDILWQNIPTESITCGVGVSFDKLQFDAAFGYKPEKTRDTSKPYGYGHPRFNIYDVQGEHTMESFEVGFSVTANL